MIVFKSGDKVICIEDCGSLVKGKVYTLYDCGQKTTYIPEDVDYDKVNTGLVTLETETWIYHKTIYPHIQKCGVKSNKPGWF